MNGKTHTAAGIACSITAAYAAAPDALSIPVLALGSAAAVMASTLPDCDLYENNMKAALQCMVQLAVFCILSQWLTQNPANWQYALFFIVVIFMGAMTSHRSMTHSIVALFAFSWLFYVMIGENRTITLWFFIAYASHLVLDVLNKRGEMLLWPFTSERFCLKLSKSESKLGDLIFRAASIWYIAALAWILFQKYGQMWISRA